MSSGCSVSVCRRGADLFMYVEQPTAILVAGCCVPTANGCFCCCFCAAATGAAADHGCRTG